MKQYKAVPGPININVGKGGAQTAFNLFADIINREAKEGWEYHSMETISVTEKPGCMQQPVPMHYYMLIFVKDDEQFMKRMTEAAARVGAKKNEGLETDGDAALQTGDDDDKLRAALEIIYDTGRASTSLLQRKLSIGYGRAAKILDALEEQGFIGPQEGSKPRTILISRQDYMERYLNDNIPNGSSGNDGADE